MDLILKAVVYNLCAKACFDAAEEAFLDCKFDESNASMEHAARYLHRSNEALAESVRADG